MRFLMESHYERWMSMSMEVVIQMKWLKLFIKLFKLKNLHYKVGFYAAIFDCIETDSTDKIYEKC
jgi:hypothetical protein